MATAEERHLTTLTASEEYVSSSMVDTNTGTRGVQIIDASQFDVATATDRGTGSQNHAYKADGADMKLEYDNNWSSKNNCVSARSREKLTLPVLIQSQLQLITSVVQQRLTTNFFMLPIPINFSRIPLTMIGCMTSAV